MTNEYDVLIAGSGVAGLYAALNFAPDVRVLVLSKRELTLCNSFLAQGGVAAVVDKTNDDYRLHIADTLIAGGYKNDLRSLEILVNEGPEDVLRLIKEMGVDFDRDEAHHISMTLEGGHSRRRILHHKDSTGREITEKLLAAAQQKPNISFLENAQLASLTPAGGGFWAGLLANGEYRAVSCSYCILCTGGIGRVYPYTTNSAIATGDGITLAYELGARIKNLRLVQFHPTALFHPGETHPAYLITEAMRGYGGILRLPNGEEFMQKYDKRLSLAPRDIVARAIDKEMKIHGLDHVCLDVTHKDAEETKHHFPNIYAKCLSIGIDMTKQYIPVVPCAHYMCGGIKVDLNACSSIRRLYAVGECSCTGLHGGNRLASNSLIEAVVYADAAAHHSLEVIDQYAFNDKIPEWNDEGTMSNEEKVLIAQDMKEVGQIMSNYVGIVRSDLRLKRAWTRLDLLYEETEELFKRVKATKDICELRNMINVGYLITRQAIERKESRGLHYTIDYPKHAYDQK